MIGPDGFDYGDGWTKAICRCPGVQLLCDDGTWTSNSIMNTEYYGDVFDQKDFDEAVRKGNKYRRPMTEAEKQAEKAKEGKVIITIREISNASSDKTPSIPLSEAARIAQLPEVVAEVERQRKERMIRLGDWYWSYGRPRKCTADGLDHIYDGNHVSGVDHCTKINDPYFIALLEKGAK